MRSQFSSGFDSLFNISVNQELNIIDGFRIELVSAESNNDAINYSYDTVKKLQ